MFFLSRPTGFTTGCSTNTEVGGGGSRGEVGDIGNMIMNMMLSRHLVLCHVLPDVQGVL